MTYLMSIWHWLINYRRPSPEAKQWESQKARGE